MSKQVINNTNISPDSLYIGANKINANFTELYADFTTLSGMTSTNAYNIVILSGLANSFNPAVSYYLFEEFDGGTAITGNVGRNNWGVGSSVGGAFSFVSPRTFGAYGEFYAQTPASTITEHWASVYFPSYSDASGDGVFPGNTPFDLKMRVALVNTSGTGGGTNGNKVYTWGLMETYDVALDTMSNGAYFYAINSGLVQAVCQVGGVSTIASTGVAQSPSYLDYEIKSTGSAVNFYISGILVQTISTNIPTSGMKFAFYVQGAKDNVTRQINVDYCYCTATISR